MTETLESRETARVTPELLGEITRRIVDRFRPEKVILFGSHAWGTPMQDSDVDLLVVMESDLRPAERSAQISMACRPRFVRTDILVRTPSELERRLMLKDPFIGRILRDGKVLYER